MAECSACGKWLDSPPPPPGAKELIYALCEACIEKRNRINELKKKDCPRCGKRELLQSSGTCFMCEVEVYLKDGERE